MSLPNQKPDLEDSINVTETHGRLAREAAAAVREKRIADNGSDPISLWLISACGLVLLVAGGILGGAGQLFSYDAVFREGYVRTPPPGTAETGPVPKEALAAYMSRGAKIYSVKCNGCPSRPPSAGKLIHPPVSPLVPLQLPPESKETPGS